MPSNGEVVVFLKEFGESMEVAIEATPSWYWLYDCLEDEDFKVKLSHPLRTKVIFVSLHRLFLWWSCKDRICYLDELGRLRLISRWYESLSTFGGFRCFWRLIYSRSIEVNWDLS